MIAPLFQAAAFAIFALFDASFWSARVVSAVGGSAILAAFWAVYRRVASPEALLLVLAMLAVEMDLVALSRLAIPEMAAMSLSLGAFLLILGDRPGRPRLVVAGLLTAAAVGMKATVLPVVPIFAAVVLARRPAPAMGLTRAAALASFAAGLLGPALVAGAALVAAGWTAPLAGTLRVVRSFAGFTGLNDLLAFPFDGTVRPVLGIWGLVAWLGLLGGLAAEEGAETPARRHFAAALLWAGLFASLMFLLDYFPERYKVHVLIPLAVLIAVGITQFQGGGLRGLDSALARLRGARRFGAALLVALPTALVAGAALLSLVAATGLDPERLRVRYAAVLLPLAAVVGLVLRRLHGGRGSDSSSGFPCAGRAAGSSLGA